MRTPSSSTTAQTEAIVRLIALIVVAASIGNHATLRWSEFDPVLAMLALVLIISLRGGDGTSLGLRINPERGWRYWCRIALLFAIVILIVAIPAGSVFLLMGWKIPVPSQAPTAFRAFWFCVYAPVVEEVIFRAMLVTAIRPSLGDWGTILLGGIVFAAVHVMGGVAGSDNLIAGFMLTWTYLRSQSLLVPIAMHAGGNLIAYTFQVAAYVGWFPNL